MIEAIAKSLTRRGRCIFCGQDRVTDEHIFPAWIKKQFPRQATHFRYRGEQELGGPHRRTSRVRQGHAFTAKARKVCPDCNSGWMSSLEEQVKPILVQLFRGEDLILDAEARSILARWIAKTTIVTDALYPQMNVVSQDERTLVMSAGQAPPEWEIWLGRQSSVHWVGGLAHVAKAVYRTSEYERMKSHPNTQSTAIGIGKLLIYRAIAESW